MSLIKNVIKALKELERGENEANDSCVVENSDCSKGSNRSGDSDHSFGSDSFNEENCEDEDNDDYDNDSDDYDDEEDNDYDSEEEVNSFDNRRSKKARLSINKMQYKTGRFFCYEDSFSSEDINVEVQNVGRLKFPVNQAFIQKIIKISSKAKFGLGEKTVMDTKFRDTQTLSAEKLKVTINEKSLSSLMSRIASGLRISSGCVIEPHLYNMLIYEPGQFFKKHRDSEKIPDMVATLVIVLPSEHKGGDLIIHHGKNTHLFYGSQNFDVVKCIAFYSDCEHEIEKVTEGYRIALTYNVVLKTPNISDVIPLNKYLDNSVSKYFTGSKHPKSLVFFLNHSYSKHSLNWNMLKGTDRINAHSLLSVAKKQNRLCYLALADYKELKESHIYGDSSNNEVYEKDVSLFHFINDQNVACEPSQFGHENTYNVSEDEICCTIETSDLFKPYKKEESGPTGNEGATCDYWYRRACVIILASKWVSLEGFRHSLNELNLLTTRTGNENYILEEIRKAGNDFLQYDFWEDSSVTEILFKIVIYLKNSEIAILILSRIPKQLLNVDRIDLLAQLETQYSAETWDSIMNNWKSKDFFRDHRRNRYPYSYYYTNPFYDLLDNAIPFLKKYKTVAKSGMIINFLLGEILERFIRKNSNNERNYTLNKTSDKIDKDKILEVCALIKNCTELDYSLGEKKLIKYLETTYPPLSLSEVLFWLKDNLSPSNFFKFKNLKDYVQRLVSEKLSPLKVEDNWSLPINTGCDCKHCEKVNDFFKSKTEVKVIVPAVTRDRAHVCRFLKTYHDHVKFEILKEGSPHKILIEKLPKIKDDNNKVAKNLSTCLKKLQKITF